MGSLRSPRGRRQLLVDELVPELDAGGVVAGDGEVDLADARPVDGPQAHGARLATGIDFAAGQIVGLQFPAGMPDGHDFGMGGGIVGLDDLVPAFADDGAILDYHSAERPAVAQRHASLGERHGPLHVRFVHLRVPIVGDVPQLAAVDVHVVALQRHGEARCHPPERPHHAVGDGRILEQAPAPRETAERAIRPMLRFGILTSVE